MIFVETEE